MWRILCWLGFHDWDGHTEPEYPAPQCRRCKRWHHRDYLNKDKP